MKHHITLVMILCFATFTSAQNNFFDTQWKEVKKLENEGLTKSASALVDKIYARAKSDKNTAQRVKSIIHQSKYLQILEEDAQLKIINNFKSEIKNSDTVTKHLLENLLANLYWQYFQQNRYKFYNRSKTAQKVDDDFRTWDLETLFKEIHCYYESSLSDSTVLQQQPLENYNVLLLPQENSKEYRPTLFDFLNHNALKFYKTTENNITQPSYKFTIDNINYASESSTFTNLNLVTKDSVNLQFNALKIYQNLLKFHQKNKSSKAFVSANIERLNFVKQFAVFNDKQNEVLKTFKQEADLIKNRPTSGLYSFEVANLFVSQASRFNPKDENNTLKWKNKEAIDICNQILSKFPNSIAADKCNVLKENIRKPSLNLNTERFIAINKPQLILVNYKNIDVLDFDVYQVKSSKIIAFNRIYNPNEKQDFISKLNPTKSFKSKLKNENDFQNHSTEVVLPKLENGHYIIVAKTNSKVFATTTVQVTDFALLETQKNNQIIYQVIDRTNGEPIINANITFDYKNNRDSKKVLSKNFTTDTFGKFYFKKNNSSYNSINIKIKKDNQVAYFGNGYINRLYKRQTNTSTTYNTFLFTDRSIYRPGQTLYFKGIVTKTISKNTSIVSNEKITATLHNVNGEKLTELNFTTNNYGSFNGEFILPNDGLTGIFYIETKSNTISRSIQNFSVEEYKRPKFEANFKPVTESYKVNDEVTVNGTAIAFAGSTITNAKVVYRVKRQVNYPRWYYWSRPSYNSTAQEITFGETKTNAKGEFEITFNALADKNALKKNLPVFNYEITADITDINGETRSTKTTVRVGYHTLIATIDAPERIDKSDNNTELTLNTANLNGSFTPAKGAIKIYKLVAPKAVLRNRPWVAPDYKSLSKEEFNTQFPHITYDNESDITNRKKGKVVFETNFDTDKSKTIILKRIKNWESGNYIIELNTTDNANNEIKDKTYTYLYSNNDKTIADNKLFDISLDKTQYQPNDNAILTFGSAAKTLNITIEIEKKGEITDTQIHKLSDSKKQIKIPVTKDDIGGFIVHYSFSAFNTFQSYSLKINVPYPKTDLQIETSTFRDKLQPGQDETWRFKIKGAKGDKVAAEVLASMYDTSLDEFKRHYWNFNPINRPEYYAQSRKNASQSYGVSSFRLHFNFKGSASYNYQGFDSLNWFGFYFGQNQEYRRRNYLMKSKRISAQRPEPVMMEEMSREAPQEAAVSSLNDAAGAPNAELNQTLSGQASRVQILENEAKPGDFSDSDSKPIQIRKNLQETAFFFPQLQTDKDGNVSFNFKAPEALTKWKLQLLAHTKTLESTISEFITVTQKELMVTPNAPRFLRQGDEIVISTKISNLTEKGISGKAQLILEDALTGSTISNKMIVNYMDKPFNVEAKNNTSISWTLKIPDNIQAVQYKVIAQSDDFSDGEQNSLPVLTNRMLVTETLPMWVRSNQTKTFTLDKLKNNTSSTLNNHKLTLEITSNPAWYAVQALPYLMEYPYDCNEQTFSRFYANALAQHITKSNPRIEAVFNQWKSTDALLSNLEKNQELKSLLIQETPWLRDAQSETEQKKRIALLFDLNKMNTELKSSIRKLKNNQHTSGAWPWFNGGRDNRFITQYIISGFGHLKKLGVTTSISEESKMIEKAVLYLDRQFVKEYEDLKKYNSDIDLSKDHLSYTQLHYLYMRSFFPEIKSSKEVNRIAEYYKGQIKTYWLKRTLYAKGLMALIMHRNNEANTASKILKSLEENSITSDELGMYWKANTASWYWHQAPIETQALLIEAFSEIKNDTKTIDNLKIWLLKNKQTNKWETTKATANAVYALLLQGSEWLSVSEAVQFTVGNETISPSKLENVTIEAGTGYFKTSWTSSEIKPEQAKVTLNKKGKGIAWGALYWQYFEDLDNITPAKTPLQLKKKLFLKSNTDRGEEISEITENTKLNVGDLVKVRIELRSDRDMEFIHLKDMRAAGFEPVNVLSRYKWQDGLGYYESTKDAATNFFIDYLPKGVYIFEYDLRVNNAGNMSNGITTIQSMYAPEFSSHSEGIRVKVD